MILLQQVLSYGLIGIINTSVTFLVIAALTLQGAAPMLANAVGFAAGLIVSFVLNRSLTFRSSKDATIVPFLSAFAVCYGLNLLALNLAAPLAAQHVLLPQLAGVLVYNVAFFVLMRYWVFADGRDTR
jgi:putative flippase GtrA